MFVRTFSFLLIVFYGINITVNCVKFIPQRTNLTFVSAKYFENASVNVRRSSRRGEYVFNMYGNILVPFGNNVTIHIIMYEHSSKYNQYIRSFIEFHFKLCDMILKDQLFGAVLRKQGVTKCPVLPGPIAWSNMTLSGEFNFDWPFEKGKAEGLLKSESYGELMGSLEIIFSIQNNKRHG